MPEKFYYVPLPRLPRLRMGVVRELRRPRMPDLRLAAATGRGHRSWRRRRRVLRSWVVSHSVDAVTWTLVLALAVVLGVLAAIL